MSGPPTLVHRLRDHALEKPDVPALVFVQGPSGERTLTWGALHDRAARFATVLRGEGLSAPDVVLLDLPLGPDLVSLYWGALRLGAVPCILPARASRVEVSVHARDVRRLAEAAGGSVVGPADLERMLAAVDGAGPFRGPLPRPDDPATLIFSSGTTGPARGASHTHRAVVVQTAVLATPPDMLPADVTVSWLPLSHDMGLLAAVLAPTFAGTLAVLLPPDAWARRPTIMLDAVARHRGTVGYMPNFGFEHILRGLGRRDGAAWDLSCLRVLRCAAEPVRASTLRRFGAALRDLGSGPAALGSGYGMAEAAGPVSKHPLPGPPGVDRIDREALEREGRAVPVADDAPAADAPGAAEVVSCGHPVKTLELRIMDDEGAELGERRVGQVEIRGPGVIRSYVGEPGARPGPSFRDGWLRTGDLAYLAGGELFLCGRSTDLIIHRGRNIHPQAVEAVVAAVPGVHRTRCAAFGVDDPAAGTEGVVILCEVRGGPDAEERRRIRKAVFRRCAAHLDLAPMDVQLPPGGTVVRSSSGKIARGPTRDRYLRWRERRSGPDRGLDAAALWREVVGSLSS